MILTRRALRALPPRPSLALSRLALSPPPARAFSIRRPSYKALGHTTPATSPESAHPPPLEQDDRLGRAGEAAARAQENEARSKEGEQVVQGRTSGRMMKSLGLEGKRIVVTQPHLSLSLTMASTFLEGGASRLTLLSLPTASATSTSPSTGSEPSPVEQLRALAARNGWRDVQVEEVRLESEEADEMKEKLDEIRAKNGGETDVLCMGPPKDEEEALATQPLLHLFAESMSCAPTTSPYDLPVTSRSIILFSTPYGPRVDLPQPQLLSHLPPPNTDGTLGRKKAGAAEMSRVAAQMGAQWARRGVRVNCISPGFLRTPEVEQLLADDPSLEEKWRNATPLARVGRVEELKGVAVLLASDASRYQTGTTCVVDGGFSLC